MIPGTFDSGMISIKKAEDNVLLLGAVLPIPLIYLLSMLGPLLHRLDLLHYLLIEVIGILVGYAVSQSHSTPPLIVDDVRSGKQTPADDHVFESTISLGDGVMVESASSQFDDTVQQLEADFLRMLGHYTKGDDSFNTNYSLAVNADYPDHTFTKIYAHKHQAFTYLIHSLLSSTAATSFDFLTDVLYRPTWDKLIEESAIITLLPDPGTHAVTGRTKIAYIRMKEFFPVSSRYIILLSYICEVQWKNKRAYLNVSCSVKDELMPQLPTDAQRKVKSFIAEKDKKYIRMDSNLAGQILVDGEKGQCEMVQLADGDPKGWVPTSIASFVAGNALPNSIRKLNKLVQSLEQKSESDRLRGDVNATKIDKKSEVSAKVPVEPPKDYTNWSEMAKYGVPAIGAVLVGVIIVVKYWKK
ncbi:hypothetical protein MP638_005300 [Amoeboaphelidium occidentale]|nr:hypothetical protein MP638_005300 [Amoeboaphelidium occidentale]